MERTKPIDEVSGATGTRCGVPLEGSSQGFPVAYSPRVSDFGNSEIQEKIGSVASEVASISGATEGQPQGAQEEKYFVALDAVSDHGAAEDQPQGVQEEERASDTARGLSLIHI